MATGTRSNEEAVSDAFIVAQVNSLHNSTSEFEEAVSDAFIVAQVNSLHNSTSEFEEAVSDAFIVAQVNSLHNSTSEFDETDIIKLNIKFKNLDNFKFKEILNNNHSSIENISPLYIRNMKYENFIGCSRNITNISHLSNKEKQFAILIDQIALNEEVIRGTNESKTDTFVDYLLREIGFSDYPLILKLKPLYEFRVKNKNISSIYDFSVEKDNRILLVEEDKHIKNTTLGAAWGEYQIAGEIIAGAYNNYVLHFNNSIIISIRVIGTRFTFYYTIVSLEYLNSLAKGLPIEKITIFRYPDNNIGLDYKDPNERNIIIDILQQIKCCLLKI